MRIGVDMDSVIAEILPSLVVFHNRKYATRIRKEDHRTYDLTIIWNCSPDEVMKRMFEFYFSPEFEAIQPVKGAQKGIKLLSKNHELTLITARPYEIESKSIVWLSKHFPRCFKEIYHTNQVSKDNRGSNKKSHICKKLGITTIIEDSPEYALDCSDAGIDVILRDMPWNRNVTLPSNIKRVKTWNEIIKAINWQIVI